MFVGAEGQAPILARSVALMAASGHTVSLSGWLNMAAQCRSARANTLLKVHSVGDTIALLNLFKLADDNNGWNL